MAYLFFDLDGTITDPKEGITGAYRELMQEHGLEPPPVEDLLWVIGPPLRECIPRLLPAVRTKEDIESAVQRYRHYYVNLGAMYKDTPYQGIKAVISELRRGGHVLFVATAKAHPYAAQILEHQGLVPFFRGIYGSELDGTRSFKGDLLDYLLAREAIADKDACIMIGDRDHDMRAARHAGVRSIGVTYGYGSPEELQGSGADALCDSPCDLPAVITAMLARPAAAFAGG